MVESGEVFELTAPEDRVGGFAEQAVLATDYLRAQRIRARLCRELDAWLAPYDAVLTVPTADAAPTADGPFGGEYIARASTARATSAGRPRSCSPPA